MTRQGVFPEPVERIISDLKRLPGVGRRSAERFALAFLEWPPEQLAEFAARLAALHRDVVFCRECGGFSDGEVCRICRDPTRNHSVICVVERPADIPVIEGAGAFRGVYHVLGGRISPLDHVGPESLRVEELRERLETGKVREIVLALSSDVEGEATCAFLSEELARPGVTFSRIAAGLPAGADLAYADAVTLALAIKGRRPVEER